MSKNVKDMTHGSPARLIVTFALPLICLLYTSRCV